jgi:hypothetical protein
MNAVTSNAVFNALDGNTSSIEYVSSLPVVNIKDRIYGLEESGSNPKFYAGSEDDQATYKLGGSDIFTGTQAEWDALSAAEKNEYSQANITDTSSTVFIPVDTIADGNMNPVTSNAVYDKLAVKEGNLVFASGVTITSNGFARFEQSGNVVVFSFHGLTVTPTGTSWTLLGNLPSNISKPRNDLYYSDGDSTHILLASTNGTIQLYSPGITTQQIMNAGNATYIA